MKRSAVIPLVVLLIVGLCTAVLGGAIVGGYLWYRHQQEPAVTYSGPCDPRIPFTTFTDPDWGYSISYPETWFIESYDPGELWAVSAIPEDMEPEEIPYYMAALATVRGNFSPQYSEEGEVIGVFLSRGPIDPDFSLEDYLQMLRDQGIVGTVGGWPLSIGGLLGSAVTMADETGYTRFVYLDDDPYTYTLDFEVEPGQQQEACIAISELVQNSFTLTPE